MFENSPAFCPTMLPSLQYTVLKLSEMFKLMVRTSCCTATFFPTPVNSQTVSYFWHTKTWPNCQRSKLQTSYYQHCGHQTVRPQTTRQRDLVRCKNTASRPSVSSENISSPTWNKLKQHIDTSQGMACIFRLVSELWVKTLYTDGDFFSRLNVKKHHDMMI